MKTSSGVTLPVITSSERADYKRCPKRWYWKWRLGLIPRTRTFGALDLGTWMHEALATWYGEGVTREGSLPLHFEVIARSDIEYSGTPDHAIEKAEELYSLGIEMATAYQEHYGNDPAINIVAVEIPLEFTFSHPKHGLVAAHKLKPDGVFMDKNGDLWLIEHKTAKQIQTEHLVIDDQARPYGAMAAAALRKAGVLKRGQNFRGILYNFLRKALPDQRPKNDKGQYLNQDGSVSKRQPSPFFVRKPVVMSKAARLITLSRVRDETLEITQRTLELCTKDLHPERIPKTPHKSCPKTCPFFAMCVAEEEGTDIRDMRRLMYRQEDPYLYHAESTEDTASFEIG